MGGQSSALSLKSDPNVKIGSCQIYQQIQLMSSRCSSAPRMQKVYTPRVKDGRRSNENLQVVHYNRSAQKLSYANPQHHNNPEHSPAMKKYHLKEVDPEVNQHVEHKLAMQPNISPKKEGNKNYQEQKEAPRNAQKTIQGRKLEYPAEKKVSAGNRQNDNRPQSVELKRSSASFSSMHFTDRASKSSLIKDKKQEFDQKFKVAFGYLLDNNEAYLKQRSRACIQKARPKDEIFKVKRPTITSTAQDEFHRKGTPYKQDMHPVAETVANSFGPRKVCGNSTSNEFHSGRNGPKAELAEWSDHYKLQGSLYAVTHNANAYPNHGTHEKMVPIATFNEHPMGMPHTANSTSRALLKGEYSKKADLATWNNLHPYGNSFSPNKGTTSGNQHNKKEMQPIQQWPMDDPRLIVTAGRFSTESKGQLVNPSSHQLNEQNYCDCGRKGHKH